VNGFAVSGWRLGGANRTRNCPRPRTGRATSKRLYPILFSAESVVPGFLAVEHATPPRTRTTTRMRTTQLQTANGKLPTANPLKNLA
jgi:hypothetical protein